MADWSNEYYERKEREHMELVQCCCYVVLVVLGVAAAFVFVVGALTVVRWLLGGA